MIYVKTYESMFNRFFKNNYVKNITNGLLSLLKHGKSLDGNEIDGLLALSMIYDFIHQKYYDNNTSSFYSVMSQSGDIKDSLIEIKFKGQWITIDVDCTSQYFKLNEFKYFMHLLNLYGVKTQTIKTNISRIDEYFLTLESADKFIKELTIEDMSNHNEIEKYNL